MPLGDVEASALQVTSGLLYETLLDCSDGTYKPGLAESWDVSDDRMRLAVRVRSGVRWHDHRAFGVLDVQASIEPLLRKGNDAAALRAALADVTAIELVTERTVRFVLKRPSDLVLRALCDVPILPDHIIRGTRAESAADRARADRDGSVQVRGLGAGQAHPSGAVARLLGRAAGRRRDRVRRRPRRGSRAQPNAARRDRRAGARARHPLPGPGRAHDPARRRRALPAAVAPLFVPGREPRARSAVRRALPARGVDVVGPQAVLGRAARRARAPDRRTARRPRRHPGARRSTARARSRCSKRPAIATATPTVYAIARESRSG